MLHGSAEPAQSRSIFHSGARGVNPRDRGSETALRSLANEFAPT